MVRRERVLVHGDERERVLVYGEERESFSPW